MFLLQEPTHRMLIRYHPTIGHLYVPNLRARLPNDTGWYYVTTNAQGFRSDTEFERARTGRPRILMFGDSYTAGDLCDNGDRFSDRLAALLGADVYNYGLSGSGTDQHLLIYREFARDVEADLIVLCVQIDSMRRIQVSHRESIDRVTRQRVLVPKPYFVLEDGELRVRQVPVPRERPPVGAVDPAAQPAPTRVTDWRHALLHQLRTRGGSIPMPPGLRPGSRLRSTLYRLSRVQPYPEFKSTASAGWRLMRAILDAFIREASPTPVLIVPVPTWEYYWHGAAPVYQKFFAELQDERRGVHVADVSTPLINLPRATRGRLAFRGGHFTAFGHAEVAKHIASAVKERRLLTERAPAVLASSPVSSVAHRPGRKTGSTYVLGLSCFYHNSAACLVRDGEIVAAAEEERFTRVKNDRRFPHQAVNYCLEEGGIGTADLEAVVYYDNAALTFERIMHTQLAMGSAAEDSWLRAMPGWIRYKLHVPSLIRRYLRYEGRVLQEIHHRSHCASAFYPSPHQRAAILTIDGVGEWATASIAVGRDNQIRMLEEMRFPHSLGLLYSAFTQFTGFKVNSGEYKMMGLAPYGEPRYAQAILDHLVDLKKDGSLELNLEYFAFLDRPTMTNDKFAALFGGPARRPDSRITRREMDLARSVQVVTEEAVLRMARHAHEISEGETALCLAGGVALNCVANGRLLREGPFKDVWIQPAAGDSGGAVGAALDVYHSYLGKPRMPRSGRPLQGGSYWGPSFSGDEIRGYLETFGYPARRVTEQERSDVLARALIDGKVVGNLSGRLEFGPRALGARSILGDARNTQMQAELNLRIKYRESFRPFAPSVLAERVHDYFELERESPYMLLVAPVRAERRRGVAAIGGEDLLPIVRQVRSDIPAVTHIDHSARIQTVVRDDHPVYYDLIKRFEELTGCAVIVNTSFNVRGEPIVCTPYDAYRCFMRTEMNVLALGNYVLLKEDQPTWPEGKGEGLESEDATKSERPEQPALLMRALRRIFRRDVLPLSDKLRAQGAIRVPLALSQTATSWSAYRDLRPLRECFEFAAAWDTARPEPEKVADALLAEWTPGAATSALRPVLIDLVALGLRYPPKEALEEEVSEAIYVMF